MRKRERERERERKKERKKERERGQIYQCRFMPFNSKEIERGPAMLMCGER